MTPISHPTTVLDSFLEEDDPLMRCLSRLSVKEENDPLASSARYSSRLSSIGHISTMSTSLSTNPDSTEFEDRFTSRASFDRNSLGLNNISSTILDLQPLLELRPHLKERAASFMNFSARFVSAKITAMLEKEDLISYKMITEDGKELGSIQAATSLFDSVSIVNIHINDKSCAPTIAYELAFQVLMLSRFRHTEKSGTKSVSIDKNLWLKSYLVGSYSEAGLSTRTRRERDYHAPFMQAPIETPKYSNITYITQELLEAEKDGTLTEHHPAIAECRDILAKEHRIPADDISFEYIKKNWYWKEEAQPLIVTFTALTPPRVKKPGTPIPEEGFLSEEPEINRQAKRARR